MESKGKYVIGALALALSCTSAAQQLDNCPSEAKVAPGYAAMLGGLMTPGAARPVMTEADAAAYRAYQALVTRNDWARLCRYREVNRTLPPSASRVVFLGASTTEYWGVADPGLFSGDVVNRGIGGQTTQQLLLRFTQDVLSLRPRVLHLMASSNDIVAASSPGGVTLETVQQAIDTMVSLAREHKISVVLASNFPTARIPWAPELKPAPLVMKWNAWLKEYAQTKGLAFVDYHAVLRDEAGGIPAALANDGVHPNREGYARITPLARAAIARALRDAEPGK
jgi:lysophospholipase L1-like esterase